MNGREYLQNWIKLNGGEKGYRSLDKVSAFTVAFIDRRTEYKKVPHMRRVHTRHGVITADGKGDMRQRTRREICVAWKERLRRSSRYW